MGANPNVARERGMNTLPLVEAARNANIAMVRLLLRHGADIRICGYHTLDAACMNRANYEMVALLLRLGVKPTARVHGETWSGPLLMASLTSPPRTVKLLLDHGAPIELGDAN